MSPMMKAWLLNDFTGVPQLHLADAPDPIPARGEAVLRVLFAGLNPADRYLAEGQYPAKPSLPHILGRDGIGIVEQVGQDVTQFKPGQKATIVRSEIGVSRAGTFALEPRGFGSDFGRISTDDQTPRRRHGRFGRPQ